MAKEKDEKKSLDAAEDVVEQEQAEFPVTLTEFLSEIPQTKIETKQGFERLCGKEKITGSKQRDEWQKLFKLFETKPTSKQWAQWVKEGGK